MTPEELYDKFSQTFPNVVIVHLGGRWVFGRMVELAHLDGGKVCRLGDKYGIEVLAEAEEWTDLVEKVLAKGSKGDVS